MFPQLYHAHHNRYLEDLPFWLAIAAETGGPMLELGCGTGRVLIPLVKAGYSCIGLDKDQAMLSFLQVEAGLQMLPAPMVVTADMCRFHLARKFPLIISPCNTYSTLNESERARCLTCVAAHLSPKGIFTISIPNPEVLQRLPVRSEAELEDEFVHPISGNPVQVSSAWRRRKDKFIVSWNYDHLLPDGRVEHQEVESSHHITPLKSLLLEFQGSGLKVTDVYGDFCRSAYTEESPYLVILATPIQY